MESQELRIHLNNRQNTEKELKKLTWFNEIREVNASQKYHNKRPRQHFSSRWLDRQLIEEDDVRDQLEYNLFSDDLY